MHLCPANDEEDEAFVTARSGLLLICLLLFVAKMLNYGWDSFTTRMPLWMLPQKLPGSSFNAEGATLSRGSNKGIDWRAAS
jgi:hypothetical protein